MKIQCLAVDDEPLAVKQISDYIKKTPFLELAAECQSAFDAGMILKEKPVDLMFIDINMPDLNGMEFVKSLTDKPYVVFTTAYSEYAVEGFQVDAVDYLLKPISYVGFLKSANKVKDVIDLKMNRSNLIKTTADHLFVKSHYQLVRIELDEIRYIESKHEYIILHLLHGKTVQTMMSLKSVEEHLPDDRFMRVHRSFIVNLAGISVVERGRIVFDGKVYIPVSDQYRDKFQAYIDKNFMV